MSRKNIRSSSQDHVEHTRNISRDLITKAMEMRCESYLAQVKAELLTQTIFEVDKSRKEVRQSNAQLESRVEQKTSNLRKMNVTLQHEIEEHRHTEDQLRVLSEAVEHAGECIFITDIDGHIEYANQAFYSIMGYEPSEVVGQKASILRSGEQDDVFYQSLWETILAGDTWSGSVTNLKKDQTLIPVMMTVAPILNRQGMIDAFVATQQDMTKQKELEAQFQQAQKMEALGTLVGGIAHDFNNMLAAMIGSIYLIKLESEQASDAVKENLNGLETLSFRASEMIKQLLTFARKGRLHKTNIFLGSLIKEALKLQQVSIPENIKFEHCIAQEELKVYADATQLQQLLINLINNARDAVEAVAKAEIHVLLESFVGDAAFLAKHQSLKGREFAHLCVRDNGCGIDSNDLAVIFEPFYTTKEVGKGTGLGLSMVFGAVESHQGVIEVESQAAQGTAFHIYLPLLPQEEREELKSNQLDVKHGHGETILLVDDNSLMLTSCQQVLESMGYHVLTACNGLQAVELYTAKHREIDLMMLDLVMPEMGGVEAAKLIQEKFPTAKIIFATAYDSSGVLTKEMANQYTLLAKPFAIELLSHSIRQLLEERD
ncbi:MAG: ATP-binding protein [Mariprofundaceae bacterium]